MSMPIEDLRAVPRPRLAECRQEVEGRAFAVRTTTGTAAGAEGRREDAEEVSAESLSARLHLRLRRYARGELESCGATNACSKCPTGGRVRCHLIVDPRPRPPPRPPYGAASNQSYRDAYSVLPSGSYHSASPARCSSAHLSARLRYSPIPPPHPADSAPLTASSVAPCRQKRWWQSSWAALTCEALQQHPADPLLIAPFFLAALEFCRATLVCYGMSSAESRVRKADRPVQTTLPEQTPLAAVESGQWRRRRQRRREIVLPSGGRRHGVLWRKRGSCRREGQPVTPDSIYIFYRLEN